MKEITRHLYVALSVLAVVLSINHAWAQSGEEDPPGQVDPGLTRAPGWLQIEGRLLVSRGQPVQLRGIGLGNWMLIEHFMIGLPQVDYVMRDTFEQVLGPEKARAFWSAYMDSYFSEDDMRRIRGLGFNHVRLPFSYRHLESDTQPGHWREDGFALLDRIVGWCRDQGLWVLLDLHSAPGCQATDWNAESAHGEVLLWDNLDYQNRIVNLWREIARRYRDEPTVLGYEILNEPDTDSPRQLAALNSLHLRCIRVIREVDPRHIIVANGDKHATDLRALAPETFSDPQVMAAFHFYHQYTPPLAQITSFPCTHNGVRIDEEFVIHRTGLAGRSQRESIERPEFLDEFGFHYSSPAIGSQRQIIAAVIKWCNKGQVNWNLWHYKDVRGMGLLHMREGTPWMNLLERVDAREMREAAEAAVRSYGAQVNEFMSLKAGERGWLQRETSRVLQQLMLREIVEQMRSMSVQELAALGESFSSKNFEADEAMVGILRANLHPE